MADVARLPVPFAEMASNKEARNGEQNDEYKTSYPTSHNDGWRTIANMIEPTGLGAYLETGDSIRGDSEGAWAEAMENPVGR